MTRYTFDETTKVNTLDAALQFSKEQDKRKKDVLLRPSFFEFGHDGAVPLVNVIHGEHKGATFVLEPEALNDVFKTLAPTTEYEATLTKRSRQRKPISNWLYSVPASAGVLNDQLRRSNNKQLRFRLYDTTELEGSNANTPIVVRAIVSDSYLPIDNTTVLTAAMEQTGGMPIGYNSYVSRDGFGIQSVIEQFRSGSYGVGVQTTNMETGNSSVAMRPLVQRNVCTNSLVVVGTGMSARWVHRGATATILNGFGERIAASIEYSQQAVHALESLRGVELPLRTRTYHEFVEAFCRKEGYSESFLDDMLLGAETHKDMYGFINGQTYAAKGLKFSARYRAEALAGSMVFATPKQIAELVRKY